MTFDYISLLLAAALSGTFLIVALLAIWMTAPQHRHLATTAAGLASLVAHVIAFWFYKSSPSPILACVVLALLPAGFALILASARQLYGAKRSLLDAAWSALGSTFATTILTLAGYDGIAFIAAYFTSTTLLLLTAQVYWSYRGEARPLMILVSSLFIICGLSFASCGVLLLAEGQWSLGEAPDNWAERVNVIVSVACMTGLGGLLLTLHNIRAGVQHESDALKDALTGLMNRRALHSLYAEKQFGRFMAIAMFDLDHFKRTNDLFGHAVGDEALRIFGAVMEKHTGINDHAFRLGGEEFAMVMTRVDAPQVAKIAAQICADFSSREIPTDFGPVKCTVSVGVGFGAKEGANLIQMLTEADRALYSAKRTGRNKVVFFDEIRRAG